MGTHPIFESDFDCLTEMPGRDSRVRNSNPNRPCRYFLQGRCRFGDQCRFRHAAPPGGGDRNQNDDTTSSLNVNIDGEPQINDQSTTGTSSIASMASIPRDYTERNFHQSESEVISISSESEVGDGDEDEDNEDDEDDNPLFLPVGADGPGFDIDSQFSGFGP